MAFFAILADGAADARLGVICRKKGRIVRKRSGVLLNVKIRRARHALFKELVRTTQNQYGTSPANFRRSGLTFVLPASEIISMKSKGFAEP